MMFKPYPKYKDAGVLWLGKIPEHWKVLPNRALFAEVKERDQPEEQMLSVTITKGIIRQKTLLADSSKKDSSKLDKSAYKLVSPEDIAYNKMRAWQGAIGVSEYRGIISPAYVVERPLEGSYARYFHYLLRTPAFAKEAERWSYGITSDMWSLRPEHFKMIYGCLPPLPEQTAIVRFLDFMDRRIRHYIRAKQKLIKLLEDQKQAIIHRAVTRGLNPNVRLKPSGVEWLGDVPEHWTIKKLKFIVNITSGQVDPREVEQRRKILVAPNHIKIGTGRIEYEETAEEQGADSGKYLVRRGQVIYCKIRPNLRKAAIARVDCLCSADMYPLTVKEKELRPEYLLQLLLSVPFTRFAVDCSLRVAMPKINREALGDGWIWYPNLREQDEILKQLRISITPLEMTIDQFEREIGFLREYRTRLIADIVTGKLDVREAVTQLPDEAEEPESFDDEDISLDGEEDTGNDNNDPSDEKEA
jgi:type I restriction enzyme, S subunit